MPTSIAFAVNVANLGKASPARVESRTLLARLNRGFRVAGLRAQAVASFRHTGNFVVRHSQSERAWVLETLNQTLSTDCVLISSRQLKRLIGRLEALRAPRREPGVRWTPGLVFLIKGSASGAQLQHAPNARLCRVTSSAVVAWKRDYLEPRTQRLDRYRRAGGWGGVAAVVAAQLGGTWTARAISTAAGVLKRAREAGAA